jgi:hypothetical protein
MDTDFFISAGFNYLISTVKNPKKKKQFRDAFLKLFKLIWGAFGSDEDFKAAVGVE